MSLYPKHDAALRWAQRELGVTEVPLGSNSGPRVRWYQAHTFLGGSYWPWCSAFVLTAWAEGAGRPLPYKTASAYDFYNWARRNGWTRPSAQCVPGDLLVWNVGSGHINMLEAQRGPNHVDCIDGNSHNRVRRTRRNRAQCRGGIHIPEDAIKPVVPPPEPYWVITTSENGKRKVVFSKFATEKKVLGLLPRLVTKYGKGGITIRRGGVRKK